MSPRRAPPRDRTAAPVRKLFGTDGIRGKANEPPMTPETALALGRAIALVARHRKTRPARIVIGKDTDGNTLPHDLGVDGPRQKRQTEFVGRRSLFTENARADRNQFVSLTVADDGGLLPTGAHGVERANGKSRSIGFVTSSYHSPTLGQPIALALIERGAARHGETIELRHLGMLRRAMIAPPCALDPEGTRLYA